VNHCLASVPFVGARKLSYSIKIVFSNHQITITLDRIKTKTVIKKFFIHCFFLLFADASPKDQHLKSPLRRFYNVSGSTEPVNLY
jgi:hypothetical protein